MLKMLSKKTPFDLMNIKNENMTVFHWACNYGSLEIAKMILQKSVELNINLNSGDVWGRTAFHLACWNNGHLKIIEMPF